MNRVAAEERPSDILTRPEPKLTKKEEAQVKAACRELLATLKREKLVLDWREKQQTHAGVRNAIKVEFCPCVRCLCRARAGRLLARNVMRFQAVC